jgi:hypothetical protein
VIDVLKGLANRLQGETARRITPMTAGLAVTGVDAERTGKLLAHGTTTCLLMARLEGQ